MVLRASTYLLGICETGKVASLLNLKKISTVLCLIFEIAVYID